MDTGQFCYYCQYCGQFAFSMSKSRLDEAKKRDIDGSFIIFTKESKFTLDADPNPIRILFDDSKSELRIQYVCSRCKLPVAYRRDLNSADNFPLGPPYLLFILKDAVVSSIRKGNVLARQ